MLDPCARPRETRVENYPAGVKRFTRQRQDDPREIIPARVWTGRLGGRETGRSRGQPSNRAAWRQLFPRLTLKQLELENTKLKKMLADRLLEIDVLKEINAREW